MVSERRDEPSSLMYAVFPPLRTRAGVVEAVMVEEAKVTIISASSLSMVIPPFHSPLRITLYFSLEVFVM